MTWWHAGVCPVFEEFSAVGSFTLEPPFLHHEALRIPGSQSLPSMMVRKAEESKMCCSPCPGPRTDRCSNAVPHVESPCHSTAHWGAVYHLMPVPGTEFPSIIVRWDAHNTNVPL